MQQWVTVLCHLGECDIPATSEPIRIKRDICQGDSLSPLWFCLALNSLSTLLENAGFRLRRGGKVISPLLCMI